MIHSPADPADPEAGGRAGGFSVIVATVSHAAWQNAREGMALCPGKDRTATKKKSLATLLILKRKEHHHEDRN